MGPCLVAQLAVSCTAMRHLLQRSSQPLSCNCCRRSLCCRPPRADMSAAEPGAGLKPELRAAIEEFVGENKVVAFIKVG